MRVQESTRKTQLRLLAAAVPLALLVGCGGGGGSDSTPVDTTRGTDFTGTGTGTTTSTGLSTTTSATVTAGLADLQAVIQSCFDAAPRSTQAAGGGAVTFNGGCATLLARTDPAYLNSGMNNLVFQDTIASAANFPAGAKVQAPSEVQYATVNGVTTAHANFAVLQPNGATAVLPLVASNAGGTWKFVGDKRPYELRMRSNAIRYIDYEGVPITTYESKLEVNLGGYNDSHNRIQTIAITGPGIAGTLYAHNVGTTAPNFCVTIAATAPATCAGGRNDWIKPTAAVTQGSYYQFAVTEKASLADRRAAVNYPIPLTGEVLAESTLSKQQWPTLSAGAIANVKAASAVATASTLALAYSVPAGYVTNVKVAPEPAANVTVNVTSATTATADIPAAARQRINVTLSSRLSTGTALHSEYNDY